MFKIGMIFIFAEIHLLGRPSSPYIQIFISKFFSVTAIKQFFMFILQMVFIDITLSHG
jgi:hypothetical protein